MEYPRALSQCSPLVLNTQNISFARGGGVFETLFTNTNSSLVGIVAKGWSDWLISLTFIPLTTVWIWVFDCKWERILRHLHHSIVFVDGFASPLSVVDILMLSRVTLRQCRINLVLSSVSLFLSTTRLKVSFGLAHKY